MKTVAQLAAGLMLALTTTGCGQRLELGQVSGTVKAGGQPLANVAVTFIPEGGVKGAPRSAAQTDAQGRYRLQTETQQVGAVLGMHRITVEDLAILSAPRSEDGTVLKRPPLRFSADFSNLLKSSLTREVKAGEQTIDLELSAAREKGAGTGP